MQEKQTKKCGQLLLLLLLFCIISLTDNDRQCEQKIFISEEMEGFP